MAQFGSAQFGNAVFGGEPEPALLFEIDAEVTSAARALIARGITDGTSLHTVKFSIGLGGYDPFNYKQAVPVNPDATDLDIPLPFATPDGLKIISEYEQPDTMSGCAYCALTSTEGNNFLGEVGIWAQILSSPYTHEIGDTLLAAVAHFPLIAKNSSMQYAFRVNVHF